MNWSTNRSTRIGLGRRSVLLGLLGAGVWWSLAADPASAGDASTPESTTAAAPSPGTPAMMIFVDPRTGAIRPGPAPGTTSVPLSPAVQNAISTSDLDLVETPSPVPGGGVLVDLQGRFQSPLLAVVGPDGKVRIQHLAPVPGAAANR